MSKLVVRTAIVISTLAIAVVASSAAQSVRLGATVRVSDDVVVGISYGRPYPANVVVHDRYYSDHAHRHAKAHRKLARKHRRWHAALEYEHEALHHDMRRGYVSLREHHKWHEAAAYDHHEEHRELDHKHQHTHRGHRRGHR